MFAGAEKDICDEPGMTPVSISKRMDPNKSMVKICGNL
jgi:hypothetical protein